MRILELVEQGRISAADAAILIAALDAQQGGAGRHNRRAQPALPAPRWVRVRVTDTRAGRIRADLSVPLGSVRFGPVVPSTAGPAPCPDRGQAARTGGEDAVCAALRAGRRGTILDVSSHEAGERVEIILE
jgi:hypothetical protein